MKLFLITSIIGISICSFVAGYGFAKIKWINENNIGNIRRFLFVPWNSWWNAWVRDITAKWEQENEKNNR